MQCLGIIHTMVHLHLGPIPESSLRRLCCYLPHQAPCNKSAASTSRGKPKDTKDSGLGGVEEGSGTGPPPVTVEAVLYTTPGGPVTWTATCMELRRAVQHGSPAYTAHGGQFGPDMIAGGRPYLIQEEGRAGRWVGVAGQDFMR